MRPPAQPKPSNEELHRRFTYQKAPTAARSRAHENVSTLTLRLAEQLCNICPQGRNLALALTALEDVRMRANAALATESTGESDAELVRLYGEGGERP